MPRMKKDCHNTAHTTFFWCAPASAHPHDIFTAPPRVRVTLRFRIMPRVRVLKTSKLRAPGTLQWQNTFQEEHRTPTTGHLHFLVWTSLTPRRPFHLQLGLGLGLESECRNPRSWEVQAFCQHRRQAKGSTRLSQRVSLHIFSFSPASPPWGFSCYTWGYA